MQIIKRSNRLYDSCEGCGIAKPYCICGKIKNIQIESQVFILTAEREFYRPSSTGRLFGLINKRNTEIIKWERSNPSKKLLEVLEKNRDNVFLVFPMENNIVSKVQIKEVANPIFIFIDGTWKEASKIYRKSEYLKEIPIVSLEPTYESKFDLRKGVGEENLSTIEAIVEVLKIREEKSINDIQWNYELFLQEFRRGLNNC